MHNPLKILIFEKNTLNFTFYKLRKLSRLKNKFERIVAGRTGFCANHPVPPGTVRTICKKWNKMCFYQNK